MIASHDDISAVGLSFDHDGLDLPELFIGRRDRVDVTDARVSGQRFEKFNRQGKILKCGVDVVVHDITCALTFAFRVLSASIDDLMLASFSRFARSSPSAIFQSICGSDI